MAEAQIHKVANLKLAQVYQKYSSLWQHLIASKLIYQLFYDSQQAFFFFLKPLFLI